VNEEAEKAPGKEGEGEKVIFSLRLPRQLNQRIREAALDMGVSQNALIIFAVYGYLGIPRA
jgi:predicted HicB family RNase H-like nuclease